MRSIPLSLLTILLLLAASGCPVSKLRSAGGGDTPAGPPDQPAVDVSAGKLDGSDASDDHAPGVAEPDPALAQARSEDLPMLQPILEYIRGDGADEDVGGLAEALWIPYAAALEMGPDDYAENAVIYKITTEDDAWSVYVGPPMSEFIFEFEIVHTDNVGYQLLQWGHVPDPGEGL